MPTERLMTNGRRGDRGSPRLLNAIDRLLQTPRVHGAARAAADLVDLQLSLVREALGRVAPLAHGRLLDVGCGDKPYVDLFRGYVTDYIGVENEVSFGATDASRRRALEQADVLYDGVRLPFDDQSFDTVLCVQVLEHTPTPGKLIDEIARVTAPDGLVILTAPFSFRLHEEPHDYFRFSPHGLRELCTGAGLSVREITPMGSLWSLIGHKLNTFLGLRVARVTAVGQQLGKLGHEGANVDAPRLWTLPVVAPAMAAVALAARALDRVAPDPTETLGYVVLAEPRRAVAT